METIKLSQKSLDKAKDKEPNEALKEAAENWKERKKKGKFNTLPYVGVSPDKGMVHKFKIYTKE